MIFWGNFEILLEVFIPNTPRNHCITYTNYIMIINNIINPLPRYSTTWDMDPVLSFIGKLGSKESLSLKGLSLKLGFLLAVTSMDRVSEVVSHDLRVRCFSPEGVSFQLPF